MPYRATRLRREDGTSLHEGCCCKQRMVSSAGPADALTGPNACGTAANSLPGINASNTHALGRCGYGPRLPLIVISPWARQNFVESSVTNQTSIIHFIEDNWLGGQRIGQGSYDGIANSIAQMFNFTRMRNNGYLYLNPSTGEGKPREKR